MIISYFTENNQLIQETLISGLFQGFSSSGKPIVIDAMGNVVKMDLINSTVPIEEVLALGYVAYKTGKLIYNWLR